MAPYAPNYTTFFTLKYRVCGRQHTHTIRPQAVIDGTTPLTWWSTVGRDAYYFFWQGIANQVFSDFSIISAEYTLAGEHISRPLDIGDDLPGASGPAWPPGDNGRKFADYHVTFSAKSQGGVRAPLKTFGLNLYIGADGHDIDDDGLARSGEYPWIANMRAGWVALNLCGIDGELLYFPQDATIKRNDHWLKVTRGS